MARPFIALLIISALGQGSDKPPAVYEDWGVCPREYCNYGEWTAQWSMRAYSARSLKSRVVFTVSEGENVTALTGLVATTSAGIVRFGRGVELGAVSLKTGDLAYLLTYQGSGTFRIWFKGRSYADAGPFCDDYHQADDCLGVVLKQPKHTWWSQIRNAKGQVAWVAMDDDNPGGFDLHVGPER
jgi:hypothetical protein